MFVYLIGFLITLICIYFFDLLGYIINKKYLSNRFKYTFFIGVISYLIIFEILCLVPMTYNLSFNYVKFFIVPLSIISMIILSIKFGKSYFVNFKNLIINDMLFKVSLGLGLLFGIILFIGSKSSGDGWLYLSMITSTINNNLIFSHNGVEILGKIESWHYADGYYLFQAMLAYLSKMDILVYLTTFLKIFEALFYTSAIVFMIDYFVPKHKISVFIIVILCYILGLNYFTPYLNSDEIMVHSYMHIPLGTNAINIVMTSILFIIYNAKLKKFNYVLPLFIIAMFSFSSSSLYISAAFLFIMILMDILYFKTKDNVLGYFLSIFVLSVFVSFFILKKYWILMIIFIILVAMILIFIYRLVMKMKFKLISDMAKLVLFLFFLSIGLAYIYFQDTIYLTSKMLLTDHSKYYYVSPHYYNDLFNNLIGLILFIFGSLFLYKYKKDILVFIISGYLLFANPISYRFIGSLVNRNVYHRVYSVTLTVIISIIGLYVILKIIEKYFKFDIKYVTLIIVLFIMGFNRLPGNYDIGKYNSFSEFKYKNADVYKLMQFDFPKTNNVSLNKNNGAELNTENNLDQIIRNRGDLNWVKNDIKDKYIILPKDTPHSGIVEFETDNYNVIYYNEKKIINND